MSRNVLIILVTAFTCFNIFILPVLYTVNIPVYMKIAYVATQLPVTVGMGYRLAQILNDNAKPKHALDFVILGLLLYLMMLITYAIVPNLLSPHYGQVSVGESWILHVVSSK